MPTLQAKFVQLMLTPYWLRVRSCFHYGLSVALKHSKALLVLMDH